jgi:hypothetical protein
LEFSGTIFYYKKQFISDDDKIIAMNLDYKHNHKYIYDDNNAK